ncbi:HDL280Cp [Eremothecium sinecaudum]|uniref:High osmolarity signaling protein SHO1 n=1 Tax=Eremothecium sinecaudum TaxID=45286 RepID=A0A0X8HS63_9SACH|nr:HDL280Cp [Eremothecium sinecaudum]AMD20464.1 HDL280Cp [Eremothecium sinecaudum]
MTSRVAEARQQRYSPHVRHSCNVGNLIGDPFVISTISISIMAWLVALVCSFLTEKYPKFSWWGLAYQFILFMSIIVFYIYDVVDYYKVFLSAAVSAGCVYSTNSCTQLIYSDKTPSIAGAVGFMIIATVNLLWVLYFGGDNASPTNRWVDSFSMKGIRPSLVDSSMALSRVRKSYAEKQQTAAQVYQTQEAHSQHYMSSVALNGFENTDPRASATVGFGGAPQMPIQRPGGQDTCGASTYITETTNANTGTTMGDTLGLYSNMGDELTSFPYTARALYSYEADASDAYEISFQQDEILRVGDIEGRWWKAKKANGETGIIPSNYVQLIEEKPLA